MFYISPGFFFFKCWPGTLFLRRENNSQLPALTRNHTHTHTLTRTHTRTHSYKHKQTRVRERGGNLWLKMVGFTFFCGFIFVYFLVYFRVTCILNASRGLQTFCTMVRIIIKSFVTLKLWIWSYKHVEAALSLTSALRVVPRLLRCHLQDGCAVLVMQMNFVLFSRD